MGSRSSEKKYLIIFGQLLDLLYFLNNVNVNIFPKSVHTLLSQCFVSPTHVHLHSIYFKFSCYIMFSYSLSIVFTIE